MGVPLLRERKNLGGTPGMGFMCLSGDGFAGGVMAVTEDVTGSAQKLCTWRNISSRYGIALAERTGDAHDPPGRIDPVTRCL